MTDVKQTIASNIINLMISKSLSPQEEAILAILTDKWSSKEVPQKEMAVSQKWRQASPLKEKGTKITTTTRRIRKVIRNLRVKHKIPVLHNAKGHYLPQTDEDIEQFISRLEVETKSQAASKLETYKMMKRTFGVSSSVFDNLDTIGNQIVTII